MSTCQYSCDGSDLASNFKDIHWFQLFKMCFTHLYLEWMVSVSSLMVGYWWLNVTHHSQWRDENIWCACSDEETVTFFILMHETSRNVIFLSHMVSLFWTSCCSTSCLSPLLITSYPHSRSRWKPDFCDWQVSQPIALTSGFPLIALLWEFRLQGLMCSIDNENKNFEPVRNLWETTRQTSCVVRKPGYIRCFFYPMETEKWAEDLTLRC